MCYLLVINAQPTGTVISRREREREGGGGGGREGGREREGGGKEGERCLHSDLSIARSANHDLHCKIFIA